MQALALTAFASFENNKNMLQSSRCEFCTAANTPERVEDLRPAKRIISCVGFESWRVGRQSVCRKCESQILDLQIAGELRFLVTKWRVCDEQLGSPRCIVLSDNFRFAIDLVGRGAGRNGVCQRINSRKRNRSTSFFSRFSWRYHSDA